MATVVALKNTVTARPVLTTGRFLSWQAMAKSGRIEGVDLIFPWKMVQYLNVMELVPIIAVANLGTADPGLTTVHAQVA